MKLEQAAQQALEALKQWKEHDAWHKRNDWNDEDESAITALREALAEPTKSEECAKGCPPFQVCDYCQKAEQVEQEPVAWFIKGKKRCVWWECVKGAGTPLYAAPVRTKDLTDEEITNEWESMGRGLGKYTEFARAVIAADREKNK